MDVAAYIATVMTLCFGGALVAAMVGAELIEARLIKKEQRKWTDDNE